VVKYSRISRLSKKEREDLILEFCTAVASVKKPVEAMKFIRDLLTEQEIEMLAKRLRIARLLLEGMTYKEIERDLRVGQNTVARVSEWLRVSGEGYRMIVERVEKKDHYLKDYYDEDRAYQRRFAIYHWPELLIDDLVKRSDRKQREKLQESLKVVGEKSKLYRRLDKVFKGAIQAGKKE